jgi:hypothetical protein
MALPKQLRNQIKQGQEIEKQLRKEQDEAGTTDTSQTEIDSLLAEVDPKDSSSTDNVTELHPAPEGGDPSPAPEPEPEPEPKPERTDWKQKYSVLKGKYDAEVPRLSEANRIANERITSLEDKLTAAAPEPEPEPPRADFTPEEIADYGEDLLDVMGRKVRAVVESEYRPQIDSLQTEVGDLRRELGETGQRVAKQETNEVFAELDHTVQDWRKTNVDPAFHEWLDQVDPFSGETRKNLMLNAFNRKNAHQVKAFFDKYAEENATVVPTPTAVPSGQGGTQTPATLDLNDYVAPGNPRSGGDAGAPKDKRVWSNADVGRFYSDVQKGRYKNRPDDKARIEADIIAATKEGRIR